MQQDYVAWMRLANDPSQTEEARQQYRARMEEFVRARMVSAFGWPQRRARPALDPQSLSSSSPPAITSMTPALPRNR